MPNTAIFFMVMVFVSCLGQVSADLYLPSLPAIAKSLNTTDTLSQLSVSVYMLGYSVSQLFYGPISDAVGRRKPLIIGLLICLASSIVCATAPTIYVLI